MLKLKKDTFPDGQQRESVSPEVQPPAQNILARRFAEVGRQAQDATLTRSSSFGRLALKIGVPVLVIAGVVWADSTWHFLPRPSRGPDPSGSVPNLPSLPGRGPDPSGSVPNLPSLPGQWSSGDGREVAMIDCAMSPHSPAAGRSGYRLTARVAAGRVGANGRVPTDLSGACHVEIRDASGAVVLSQDVSLASLAPS